MEKDKAWDPQIIVVDVYETLLDMSDVERKIIHLTDSKRGYLLWFELFMQYCFVDNFLDVFLGFNAVAKTTLKMAGQKLGRTISETEANDVLELLKHLPVHEEVQHGLSLLSDSGYRIVALTNVPEKVVCERMERTGLVSYFEAVLSAETVKKYKPERKVYEWASEKLKSPCSDMLMVTSHIWDVAGAANAGMRTAYVERDKNPFYPFVPNPDIICHSVPDLALKLKENKRSLQL